MGQASPTCLAFLLCESIRYDAASGKHALLGLLEDVAVPEVPTMCLDLVAYAELTGMRGRIALGLRLTKLIPGPIRPRSARTIATWGMSAAILRHPDEVAKIGIQLHDVRFPEAGAYLFILEADSIPIVARRFTVILARSAT